MKRMLSGIAGLCLALAAPSGAHAASTADIIFVVDESGSMSGEHAWLSGMVASLDADLVAAGVTNNRYGLVGFGNGQGGSLGANNLGRTIQVGGNPFGTSAQLATATGSLVTSGGFEDGYSGLDFALDTYTFRAGAAINFILVTDEDRDNGNAALTYGVMETALKNQGALLNAVVNGNFRTSTDGVALGHDSDGNAYQANGVGGFTTSAIGSASGTGTTIANYYNLALATGGAAWDLNQLRLGGATAESFTSAFVSVKVREIVTTPTDPDPTRVPDAGPGFLVLLGAFGALAALRRRTRD